MHRRRLSNFHLFRSRYDITGENFHFEMSLKRKLLNSISNALSRPELDFDFLLNNKNLDVIKENIRCRKGIGDIDAVHRLWKQIQDYPGKQEQSEQEYQSLWDKVSICSLLKMLSCS